MPQKLSVLAESGGSLKTGPLHFHSACLENLGSSYRCRCITGSSAGAKTVVLHTILARTRGTTEGSVVRKVHNHCPIQNRSVLSYHVKKSETQLCVLADKNGIQRGKLPLASVIDFTFFV